MVWVAVADVDYRKDWANQFANGPRGASPNPQQGQL